jgi:chromosome partitioning protein
VFSLVLANQKGGVGKTTTAIHVAHGLALAGSRVVLFDLDPQGNATVALQGMMSPPQAGASLVDVGPGFRLLPSPGAEAVLEHGVSVDINGLSSLAKDLASSTDWLIVDSPPRMDEWGWAGLQLCDEVLVPVQAEFFSMHGLSQMMGSLSSAADRFPGKARLMGVLPTMVNPEEALAQEVLEDLRRNLGPRMMQSMITRDPALVEAASHGKTTFAHCPWTEGALCYSELVQEILDGRTTSR